MRLNTTKTKEMLISLCRPPPDVTRIVVIDCMLERVPSVTLLGVIFKYDLSWHGHVQHIVGKAQGRLFFLNMLHHARVSPKDIIQI